MLLFKFFMQLYYISKIIWIQVKIIIKFDILINLVVANLVQYGNGVNINNIINTNIFESIKKEIYFLLFSFQLYLS